MLKKVDLNLCRCLHSPPALTDLHELLFVLIIRAAKLKTFEYQALKSVDLLSSLMNANE